MKNYLIGEVIGDIAGMPAKAKAIEKMPDALIYQAMKKLPDRIGGSASGLIRW